LIFKVKGQRSRSPEVIKDFHKNFISQELLVVETSSKNWLVATTQGYKSGLSDFWRHFRFKSSPGGQRSSNLEAVSQKLLV